MFMLFTKLIFQIHNLHNLDVTDINVFWFSKENHSMEMGMEAF